MDMKELANFIEIGRCLTALKAYSDTAPNPDVDLVKDALKFFRKYEEDLEKGADFLISLDFAGTGKASTLLLRARKGVFVGRGEKNPDKVDDYAEGFRLILSKTSANVSKIKGVVSDALTRNGLLAWGSTVDGDTFSLKELASSTKVGSLTYGRKWMRKAFESIKDLTPVEQTEQLISDITGALAQAEELKSLNAQIISGGGDRQEAEDKKGKVLKQIVEEANASSNPAAVVSAVASHMGPPSEHRSRTGKELGLSPEQEDAMLVTGRSIIAAGAGSGKTRVLAGKIVHLLREGVDPSQIMACSFTAKSAGELKERVIKYGGQRILENDTGFGTTHSIALKLLQTIDPMYKSDKMVINDDALLREAIAQVGVSPSDDAQGVNVGVSPTGPISFLDENIEVSSSEEDVLLQAIVSNALGTVNYVEKEYGPKPWSRGDRKLFEGIIANGEITVSSLTGGQKAALNKYLETNRGAKNLAKLSKTGLGDGPGYKFASLKKWADELDTDETEGEGEGEEDSVIPVNQWFNMGLSTVGNPVEETDYNKYPASVALEISRFKSDMLSPSQAWDKHQGDHLMAAALVYNAYEWLKKRDGMMDHDDYMIRFIQAMVNNRSRLEDMQARFKYILVDEAQDLNKVQHLMFGLLSGHIDADTLRPAEKMSANTYCLIGDDKQAIYEFRGATPTEFIGKSDTQGGSFVTKMITTNYRSGANIIGAANRLMEANKNQIPMACTYSPTRGEGNIGYVDVPNPQEGADFAIAQIKAESEIEGWDDWNEDYPKYGVACRTNKEIADYILGCIKHDVPFKAKPGINPFTSKTYKALFSLFDIRSASFKAQYRSILTAHKYFNFGLDKKFANFLKAQTKKSSKHKNIISYFFAKEPVYTSKTHSFRNETFVHPYVDFLAFVRNLNAPDAITFLEMVLSYEVNGLTIESMIVDGQVKENAKGSLTESAGSAGTDDEKAVGAEARKNAQGPIEVIRQLCRDKGDIEEVIDLIISFRDKSAKLEVKEDDKRKAVVLDTAHGWKGLEAKNIYIPMGEGVFPSKKAVKEGSVEAMESERRLAYVALTRGRDSVTIISPTETPKSRFLEDACIRPFSGNVNNVNTKVSSFMQMADDALADMILDDNESDFVLGY